MLGLSCMWMAIAQCGEPCMRKALQYAIAACSPIGCRLHWTVCPHCRLTLMGPAERPWAVVVTGYDGLATLASSYTRSPFLRPL